jgi:WD40 repeat protein/serine/threonine protein kinase/DNA-binding XRE family transcriptional regulator
MNRDVTFGAIVKERRYHLGLTQTELARRASCAAITIRKIEADALRPSLQIAEQLAVALNIPEEEVGAFIRLARAESDPSPLPTPEPIPAEIGRPDLSGRAIRGFELGERIGTGGYGVVYRARQATVSREVAVKIILPHYADRPEFIRRFETEAHLVARLEHPHIVPLYDYWREPGKAFLVMRLLSGGSLESRLNNGPLPAETILSLMEQICAGLHAAHRAGIIHRDIKPANILLDADGNAYLADFGIAKLIGQDTPANVTLEGTVIGSPAYISPEQILAEPVKPQTDIYSLGVMLYELLTGQKPFSGPTPFAFIQQHLNQPLPLLAEANQTSKVLKSFEVSDKHSLPTALDIVIGRATAKDQRERYPDILTMLTDLRRAMTPGSTAATLAASRPVEAEPAHVSAMLKLPDLENPYKGLRPFTEADAADFFGRDTLIQDLLTRLSELNDPAVPAAGQDLGRFLAVIGPSGSGKSSVVRAGLVPVLRSGGLPGSEKWFIVDMLPGSHPLEELETALLRVAVNPPENLLELLRQDERGLLRAVRHILPADETVELVLIIDQFEEIFTLVEDEATRAHLLNSLVTATLDPHSRLRVIITLRADFTDQPLQYVDFGDMVRQRSEFVLPLTLDELQQAIVGPTERAGLSLEPELVPAIIRDIGDQPGMLPLLQYALTELFERRDGRLLTLAAYQASGGVLGALARRADELYQGLDDADRVAARQLFSRLVTLGEGVEDTRRRVLRAELAALNSVREQGSEGAGENSTQYTPRNTEHESISNLPSPISQVIDLFGQYRLLTFDRDPVTRGPTVEVAHEALIREWGQLRRWLDEDREFLLWQQRLRAGLRQWDISQQDEGALLRGAPLAEAENWFNRRQPDLTETERGFIRASLDLRQRRETERETQRQRELETAQKLAATEQHAARRLRWLAVGLMVFLVVAAGLTVFAFNQQAEAEANLALSESQRLAAEASAILQGGGDAELAALLSLQALNTAYTTQADIALQQASKGDYGRRLFTGHTSAVTGLAFSPDGRLALSGSTDQTARLWDVQSGQLLRTLTGHTGIIGAVAFSPDGQMALTGSDDGTTRLWDVATGQELQSLTGYINLAKGVAFSPDGQYAFIGSEEGFVLRWDLRETGQEVRLIEETEGISTIALSPDGQYMLTGYEFANDLHLWEVATGQEVRRLTGPSGGVNSVTFSPDGRYALAADSDGVIRVWDLQQADAEPRLLTGHTEVINRVRVSPDGRYALSSSSDSTTRLWDLETGTEIRRFATARPVNSLAFSPNGRLVLMGDDVGDIRLWDVQAHPDPRTFSRHANVVTSAKFSPDGRTLLTGSGDQTARLWDVATGRELRVLAGHGDWVITVAMSPDGHYALTSGAGDRTARLWDTETGQEMRVFTHPTSLCGVAFSPDGRYMVSGGDDTIVRLWDVETGQEVHTFSGHTQIVLAVAYSPDGRYILTGSGDSTARLWDVETGQEVRQFPYAGFVNGVSFSPDGKYILTAAGENSAQLWEVETGLALGRFSGENGVFSPDGKYILTGGFKTAYLWDRATGRQLRAFGMANNLWGVVFSPDSQFILIYGSEKTAQLWDTDYHVLMDSVCARVLRDFTDQEREQYGINDQQPTCP